jgi:hypothetical protein
MSAKNYQCERCLVFFSSKQRYNSHINKLKTCDISPLSSVVDNNLLAIKGVDIIKCKYCNKLFDKKYRLERHLNSVNSKCYIERHARKSDEGKYGTIINNINNSINNNNILPLIFVEHGNECVKHITKEVMLKMLAQPNFIKFCVDLMKVTYFDRKVPKNNNWFIAYPKNDKAGIEFNHETFQFERKPTIDIIDDKFSNMMDLLQPLIEEIYREDEETENLTHIQRMNIKRYYGYFGVMQISKESPEIYQALHDLAYNMRSVPMTTFKEQGLDAKYLSIKF